MPETEPQPQPSSLPIVPSEITNRLLERITSPRDNLESLTSDVFSDLITSNRQLAEIVNKVFNERFGTLSAINGAVKGVAVILKAYDYLKDSDLLLRFSSLQPDHLTLAQQTLEQSLPKKAQELSVLQKLLDLPRIPEAQISLNECLKKAEGYASGEEQFSSSGASTISTIKLHSEAKQGLKQGATAMYKTLEALWPKLYPPQTPTQQPTTQ